MDTVISLAFSLYSVLLSMFSHVKVPVVSLFFSAGGEFVLFCPCFAVYDVAFEVGVVFDLVSYSFFPYVDAALFSNTFYIEFH